MGNTLIKSSEDQRINNSLLGKEISKMFAEKKIEYKNSNGTYKIPINKIRACCLGALKEKPETNDFITVNLPDALDETNNYCSGDEKRCIGTTKLGLQIKGDPSKECIIKLSDKKDDTLDFTKGDKSKCDGFMVNHCAKSLYDKGCLVCKGTKKDSNGFKICTPQWNVENKNCFNKDGTLIYGPEECVCINSQTGYTLNRNPSTDATGEFTSTKNPWEVKGDSNNDYTKYSLNLFNYDIQYQKPNVFDNRCSNRMNNGAVEAGKSVAYLLPDYLGQPNICLNMINLGGNSNFGKTQLSNIKQTNNCGDTGPATAPDIWGNLEKEKKCKSEGYDSCEDKTNKINIANKKKEDAAKQKKIEEENAAKQKKTEEDNAAKQKKIADAIAKQKATTTPTPTTTPTTLKFSKTQIGIMIGGLILFIALLVILFSGSDKKPETNTN